jgi:hypothetical protein
MTKNDNVLTAMPIRSPVLEEDLEEDDESVVKFQQQYCISTSLQERCLKSTHKI